MSRKLALIWVIFTCVKFGQCRDVSKIFHHCLQVPEQDFYNKRLNQSIHCFRANFKTGVPELGVPSFDPLQSNLSEINIDNPLLYTNIQVQDVVIRGLTDFKLTKVWSSKRFDSLEPNYETVEYYFNRITFEAKYRGKANFFGLVAYTGQGRLLITLNSVTLFTETYYQKDSPLVRDFQSTTHVSNTTVSVTGVENDEDLSTLVSVALSRMLQYLFKSFPDRVSEVVNEMGMTLLNKLYEGMGYEDYYNAVSYSTCKHIYN